MRRRVQRGVGRATSENKVLKYTVVPPGVTPLVEKDRTRVKYVMWSLVVVAVGASFRCTFFHPFKSSEGGEAVNRGAKDKGHYTLWQRLEKRFPGGVSLFEM